MAATRTRVRRRAARRKQVPRVRRQASTSTQAARHEARAQQQPEGGLTIGGARDPAEAAADRVAARALTGPVPHVGAAADPGARASGAPVRRAIMASDAAGLQAHLTTDLGATDVKTTGQTLKSTTRQDTGSIRTQCAQNMLVSPRFFTIKGASAEETKASFDAHVDAREKVVEFAKAIRLGFTADEPKLDPKLHSMIFDELDSRLAAAEAEQKQTGKDENEIADYLKRITPINLQSVFDDIAGKAEFQTQVEQIWQKSQEFDRAKAKTAPEFATACFLASNIVLFGATQGPAAVDFADTAVGESADRTTPSWTDWVPGDLGYIENTGTQTPKAGMEGENIISVGDGKIWAHWDPARPIVTLNEMFDKVQSWNGSAQLDPKRTFPKTGLE